MRHGRNTAASVLVLKPHLRDESDMLAQGFTRSGASMFFVAGILAALAGMFYAAGHHQIGSVGVTMCRYGPTFCDNPHWVFIAAALAAVWGAFVSIR
jgi:hypothetical protein